MKIINPITEQVLTIEEFNIKDIPQLITNLQENGKNWDLQSLAKRSNILKNIISKIKLKKDFLAKTICLEMGKPFNLAQIEVNRTIDEAEYMIANAEDYLSIQKVSEGEIHYSACGVVAVISPWNFPVMLPMRSIIPALLAGNAVAFKPSEFASQTAIELSKFFNIPELDQIFTCIIGDKEHGKVLTESNVNFIAFTGSINVGKQIYETAAKQFKKVSLELGGLDPAIVLSDVDLDQTSELILQGNTFNSGQVCNAIKRVYVEEAIYQDFLEKIIQASKTLSIGDPLQNPDLGPLVSLEQLQKVESFIQDAKLKGAIIHTGGARLNCSGFYFPSTIISNVNQTMKLLQEEAFGPVLPIIPVRNWEEAVKLANESCYGLAASIWTKDLILAKKIAAQLEVATVVINDFKAGGPGTPWGGIKHSGIGRTKIKDFLKDLSNIKFIKNI